MRTKNKSISTLYDLLVNHFGDPGTRQEADIISSECSSLTRLVAYWLKYVEVDSLSDYVRNQLIDLVNDR